MGEILKARRDETTSRFQQLKDKLAGSEVLLADRACLYATGSFGRGEASIHSDLDLFTVGLSDKNGQRLFRRLDEIRLMANLIETTDALGIPEFSGDGEYLLVHYTKEELIEALGDQHDDARIPSPHVCYFSSKVSR